MSNHTYQARPDFNKIEANAMNDKISGIVGMIKRGVPLDKAVAYFFSVLSQEEIDRMRADSEMDAYSNPNHRPHEIEQGKRDRILQYVRDALALRGETNE